LTYQLFKTRIKRLGLLASEFSIIANISYSTIYRYWKKNDAVPKYIELLIDSLFLIEEEKRDIFIQNELKKVKNGK
jgi:predicted transcriptional regulator